MESTEISKYTNCIMTCGWADGVNRTPSTLYSLNPEFRLYRKKTARRNAQEAHFLDCLSRHKIAPERVVYVGKFKKETEKYVKESPSLLRLFFENYGVEVDCSILSDNERSLFEGGVSVLEEIGFENHETSINTFP